MGENANESLASHRIILCTRTGCALPVLFSHHTAAVSATHLTHHVTQFRQSIVMVCGGVFHQVSVGSMCLQQRNMRRKGKKIFQISVYGANGAPQARASLVQRLRPQARFGAQPPKAALSAEMRWPKYLILVGGIVKNDNPPVKIGTTATFDSPLCTRGPLAAAPLTARQTEI